MINVALGTATNPVALCSLAFAVLFASSALAQEQLTRDEGNVVSFGFATQLGSGVYSISGRTLQIYRLPFSYEFRPADENRFGIELTLPVTFGFYDFKLRDVAQAELPSSVDSLSFVPGVTLSFLVRPAWRLEPYIEAGISASGDSRANATVYSGGLRSYYAFGRNAVGWLLYNDLTYAGVDFRGGIAADDFVRLRTALTARRAFTRTSRGDYLLYAMQEFYVDQPRGVVESSGPHGNSVQYEVGVTFGTVEPVKIWRIPLPRVGIGYRFGPDVEVFRLVLGSPF